MIYYCCECEIHFSEEKIIEIKPDGGSFHEDCKMDDFIQLTESEIIDELNKELI